jgi:hypothetical protein
MKKVTIIVSMLFALTITAQNSTEIWMSYELKPKKGMIEKFEQAAEKKMKKYNSTAETAMFTFNIMDGENQGMYSRVIGYKDWDFMNSQEDRSDELKYWRDNVDPYIENSTGWKVWRREKGVSHNWSPETTFKYMLVQRRFIKPGMDQDIYHFMQRAKKVYEKHNYTGIEGVFRVISGGNTNEYIICTGFNEYGAGGEFPDTEKNLEELYNEMFGWESYRKDARLYNEALEMYSRTTERYHFNEKLSTSSN